MAFIACNLIFISQYHAHDTQENEVYHIKVENKFSDQ